MVTGIEIVCLALAIPPRVIEAMKKAPFVINPNKTSKHNGWVDDFFDDLEYELTVFHLNLKNFVQSLDADEAEKEKLLKCSDPGQGYYAEPSEELWDAFKLYLGASTGSFERSVEVILEQVAKLVKDKPRSNSLPVPLSSERTNKSENNTRQKLKSLLVDAPVWDRFSFAFNTEKRRRKLDRISKHNDRIQNLLRHGVDDNSKGRTHKKETPNRDTPHFGIRQKISELPKTIAQFCCRCSEAGHDILVGLFQPCRNGDPVFLDLLMDLGTPEKRCWGESKVHVTLDPNNPHGASQLTIADSEATFNVSTSSSRTTPRGSIAGATLTHSPVDSPSSFSSTARLRSQSITHSHINNDASREDSRRSESKQDRPNKVTALCETINDSRRERMRSELRYHQNTLWHAAPKTKQMIDTSHKEFALSHLFEGRFHMKHRKSLQVIIARSLLFYPWDNDHSISKQTLYFMGTTNTALYTPFTWLHPKHEANDNADYHSDDEFVAEEKETYGMSLNDILASVATLLLELELGKPIESLRTEEDLDVDGNPTPYTDYFATLRCLDEHSDNMYHRILNTINTCLSFECSSEVASLDDPEILRQIHDLIVVPLEEDLETAFPGKLDELEKEIAEQTESKQRPFPRLGPRKQQKKVAIASGNAVLSQTEESAAELITSAPTTDTVSFSATTPLPTPTEEPIGSVTNSAPIPSDKPASTVSENPIAIRGFQYLTAAVTPCLCTSAQQPP